MDKKYEIVNAIELMRLERNLEPSDVKETWDFMTKEEKTIYQDRFQNFLRYYLKLRAVEDELLKITDEIEKIKPKAIQETSECPLDHDLEKKELQRKLDSDIRSTLIRESLGSLYELYINSLSNIFISLKTFLYRNPSYILKISNYIEENDTGSGYIHYNSYVRMIELYNIRVVLNKWQLNLLYNYLHWEENNTIDILPFINGIIGDQNESIEYLPQTKTYPLFNPNKVVFYEKEYLDLHPEDEINLWKCCVYGRKSWKDDYTKYWTTQIINDDGNLVGRNVLFLVKIGV